jgi:UDP-N-acetylmuramyl pentapeptide synthase
MHSLTLVKTVIAAAEACGLPLTECCERIAAFAPSTHFLRIRKLATGAECIDDSGTSNQVGFEAALAVLAHRKESRKVVIVSGIVDLGVHSESIHTKLAQQVAQLGAECWYVGTAGKEPFVKILGSACVTDENEIQRKMAKLTSSDVVLLEGKMPSWIAL